MAAPGSGLNNTPIFLDHWMNGMKNGVQGGHGLMRKFVRIFMAFYFSNSLSHHVNIYMILCMYYMLTKNAKKISLVQQVFNVVGLYQKIQMLFLLFFFVML